MSLASEPSASAMERSGVPRPCPCCGETGFKATPHQQDGWKLVACDGCGHVYMPVVPSYEEVGTVYEWSESFSREAKKRKARAPLLSWIDQKTRFRTRLFGKKNPISFVRKHAATGHVIDLGCGSGGYLAEAGGGYTLYGIDISPVLAAQADALFARSGGKAVCASCADGLEQFEDETFDAAILRSYLEHEPQAFEVMRNLFGKLKPGGIAVIKVPNYDSLNRLIRGEKWCGFRYPDHVNYFTPATLAVLAKRCGYAFEQGILDRLPTDDNLWAILRRPFAP